MAIQTGKPTELQTEEAIRAKELSRAIGGVIVGAILTIITFLALAYQTQINQLYNVVATLSVFILEAFILIYLLRRGRLLLVAWLFVLGYCLTTAVVTTYVSGIEYIVGINIIWQTIILAPQIFPKQQMNNAIVASVIIGFFIVSLTVFGSSARYPVPVLVQIILAVLGGLALLGYSFNAARQFPRYALRTKLLIIFCIISFVSIGSVTVFVSLSTRETVIEDIKINLNSVAKTRATAIGDLLARQIEVLQSLALNDALQESVSQVNNGYTANVQEIQTQLQALDQPWQEALSTDPLVRQYLRNEISSELNEFRNTFPDHIEVFITDLYGGLVSTNNRTSDFYQADEAWWQAAFNQGQGAIYISAPVFDESSDAFGLIIAVPIYESNSNKIIGILRSTYQASALIEYLELTTPGVTGHAELYFSDGRRFDFHNNQDGDYINDLPLITSLQAAQDNYLEAEYDGEPSFVSFASVRPIRGDSAITNLSWSVLVYHHRADALAPLGDQLSVVLLIAILFLVLISLSAFTISYFLASPISEVASVANKVAAGDLTVKAMIQTDDEIGQLATAFNIMTERLEETIDALETQVSERTQELELVLDLNKRVSSILQLDELLQEIVIVTKETFNYYHVHIYLLDETGESLVMREGYGIAGAAMKQQNHSIFMGHPNSIVALAAREGRPIIVSDVKEDPHWLENELLPHTRAEIAVPVISDGHVVGVLDVQSEVVGDLTESDSLILRALADQIAIAVRNAERFRETEIALHQAEQLQSFYLDQAWTKFRNTQSVKNFEVRRSDNLAPLKDKETPEAQLALTQNQTVTLNLSGETQVADNENDKRNVLATPLRISGQVIGVLGLEDENENRVWTKDDIALIEAISIQMSLAIENARLFDETQRNSWRDQMVSETTAQVWSSPEVEKVMQAAVAQLGEKLGASEVVIRLGSDIE